MYFPLLRGRQFELIALRELIEKKLIGKNILPIIEPVKPTTTLNTTLSAFRTAGANIAVIRNPRVGEFVSKLRNPDNEKVTEKFYAEIEKGSYSIISMVTRFHLYLSKSTRFPSTLTPSLSNKRIC